MALSAVSVTEDNRVYEIAILYPYPIQPKEEQELLKGVEEIFAEAGARVMLKDTWGRRGLAYAIGGHREGNFVLYYLDLDPIKVKEINAQLRILRGVLRHLIVKPPKNYKIMPYAEHYAQWKERDRLEGEAREQEREDKVKKQMVEKAKRKASDEKKVEKKSDAPAVTEADLTKQLEKLISDKDLEL